MDSFKTDTFMCLADVSSKQLVPSTQTTVTGNLAVGRGYAGYLKECEKLDLTRRRWQALPDMQDGRSGFNPCLFNKWVYVCGWGSKLVEAFSPRTETFLALQLTLPQTDSGCTLYVLGQMLVLHSGGYITKYHAKPKGQLFQSFQAKHKGLEEKWSNTQPVLDSNYGYFFIFQYDRCICLTMAKGKVKRTIT